MRIVCISDTHGLHEHVDVPDGDVLVHAGDMTKRGRPPEVRAFGDWFAALPHARKVLVAGNHDFLFESDAEQAYELVRASEYSFLRDSGVEIDGVRFWGSPWQPWFHDWAFNLPRGEALAKVWREVPTDTDVLVTHSPPHGTLDAVARDGSSVGCEALAERLEELHVGLHVFGHIHEAHGVVRSSGGRLSVNASIANLRYEPVQPAIVVDRIDGRFQRVDAP